jgi:ATP adenylyltransferase
MRACRLCFGDTHSQVGRAEWDRPLLETDNFYVVPSLGALVSGWLLITPKQHFICVGEIPESRWEELLELKNSVRKSMAERFDNVVVFEHGPSKPSCDIGCGVDHAHLHILPFSDSIVRATKEYLPAGVDWQPGRLKECAKAYEEGLSYLFFEPTQGPSLIARSNGFMSQIFRRAIARELNLDSEFNWRDFPQYQNVSATVESLRNLSGGPQLCKTQIMKAA